MRVVHLSPQRAFQEQNTLQEMQALQAVGHDVVVVSAGPGTRGESKVVLKGIEHIILATGALTAPGRVLRFLRAAARYVTNLEPDEVSCRDLDTLTAGIKVKRQWEGVRKVRLVYDFHDPYPLMVEDDIPTFVVRMLTVYERRRLRNVDLALPSDDGRRDWLLAQGYQGPAPVILNCRNPAKTMLPFPGQKTLSYTGTLHRNRFIQQMVSAMDRIDATLLVAGPDAEGEFWNTWLRQIAKTNPKVRFLGRLSPEKSLEVLQRSHVSVQMADPKNSLNRLGPYNRAFDAMSVGRAVIATEGTVNGDIVKGLKMGCTSMYDPKAYIESVNFMLNETDSLFAMGKNGFQACQEQFNWDSQAVKLVKAYEAL